MTWTYNLSQSTLLDQIRFAIGDSDSERQLLQDEEINAVLTRRANDPVATLIELAESLEAKFVRRAESRSGDIIADFLTVAGKYAALASRYRKRRTKGFSLNNMADREADKEQTTIMQPSIARDQYDYFGISE